MTNNARWEQDLLDVGFPPFTFIEGCEVSEIVGEDWKLLASADDTGIAVSVERPGAKSELLYFHPAVYGDGSVAVVPDEAIQQAAFAARDWLSVHHNPSLLPLGRQVTKPTTRRRFG